MDLLFFYCDVTSALLLCGEIFQWKFLCVQKSNKSIDAFPIRFDIIWSEINGMIDVVDTWEILERSHEHKCDNTP